MGDEPTSDGIEFDPDNHELPGDWEWLTEAQTFDSNEKYVLYFGHNEATVGGFLGQIDNYVNPQGADSNLWDIHTREIVEPEWEGHPSDTVPEGDATACETFHQLKSCLDRISKFIEEYHPDTLEE